MLGIGKSFSPFGNGKHNFGYIPDPPETEFCCDAEKDETLCESCVFYEVSHGIPMCCGNEYKENEKSPRT